MQFLRTRFRMMFFHVLNQMVKFPGGMRFFNRVYEHSGPAIVHILNTHIILPNKNFTWKICLNNGRAVLTALVENKPMTRHVAMGYRWHDSSINRIETVMVDYLAANYLATAFYIDGGANMGMRSMCALSRKLNVIMIEPNVETNVDNLNRCRLNNFSNYELHEVGLSNEDTSKTIYYDSSSYLSTLDTLTAAKDGMVITSEAIIKVNRLDTILQGKLKVQNQFFIKLDIEGHEIAALEGCAELLVEPNVSFLIEINTKGDHIYKIFKKMWDLGFRVYEKIPLEKNDVFLRERFEKDTHENYVSDDFLFVNSPEVIRLFQRHVA